MHTITYSLIHTAERKKEALKRQHEEGWRGLACAHAALQNPAAIAELAVGHGTYVRMCMHAYIHA